MLNHRIPPRFLSTLPLLLLCAACNSGDIQDTGATAYDTELDAINSDITTIEAKRPDTPRTALRHVYHLYRRAGLTGDFEHYKDVEKALNKAEDTFGRSRQLLLFKADFNFKLHRLEQAEQAVAEAEAITASTHTKTLKADIALQRGRYETALATYKAVTGEDAAWDNLARLAHYHANTGNTGQADVLYRRAQEKLSAKQMRHYAWLELQRGILDLEYRRYPEALAHYLHAEQAYSGYWLIREHIAEVYELLGRTAEAIDLYERVIEQTGHPEFTGALASIVEKINPQRAAMLHERTAKRFEQRYALYPEAALGHYAEYVLEHEPADPRLTDFAERNHALRADASSKVLLAKVQLKTGRQAAARETMRLVMQTPWRTPEIEDLAAELGLIQ